MSGSESSNTSDDINKREPPSTIIEALLYLCTSDELSIGTLKETINRPGLSPIYYGNYDYKRDPDKTLSVLHHACDNKNVTLEIIEFLLNNDMKSLPDAAQTLSTEFTTWQDENNSTRETYPLHIACCNEHCPNDVIRLLIEQYPPACEHLSNIDEGVHDCNEIAGLPLHYYLARNKNVDIDTVKLLVEKYPESLMISDEEDDEICYPIHALLSNENTDNIHEILTYMHEHNPASHHVLNTISSTLLHVACQRQGVNLATIENLFNAWPEAIRMIDNGGYLPIHDLCNNNKIDDTAALAILQFMLDADPTLPRVRTGEEGYLPIHLAVDRMSVDFCKVLIKTYPESVKVGANDDNLPIHEACRFRDRDDAVDIVEYLLQLYPESINVQDSEGLLPIHLAALGGNAKTIALLLEHDPDGASKKTEDEKKYIPLHLACQRSTLDIVKVLYDAYPQAIHVRGEEDGETPVSIVESGPMKRFLKAQVLYARKAQDMKTMTTLDHNGWLPLHHALKDKAPLGSIRLLLEGNPSAIQTADSRMAFPLHIACQFSSVKVVRYLVGESNEHIVGHLDANKDSVLHYACRGRNLDVIKYLMDNHSSVVVSVEMNLDKELPLHLLCEYGKSREDSDSTQYFETIWLMLLADPEALLS